MRSVRPPARRFLLVGLVAGAGVLLSGCGLLGPAAPDRNDDGEIVSASDADVFALKVGDCLNTAGLGDEFGSVPTVPCAEPHDAVITGELTLTDEQGVPATNPNGKKAADEACVAAYEAWTPTSGELADWTPNYFSPSPESWANGDRLVQCIAVKA